MQETVDEIIRYFQVPNPDDAVLSAPGFPGDRYFAVGDFIVFFDLQASPDHTASGMDSVPTFAVLSPNGEVKYNYFLITYGLGDLLEYWSSLAA